MQEFNPEVLKQLYQQQPDSHKGQNGKLFIIAGSALFFKDRPYILNY